MIISRFGSEELFADLFFQKAISVEKEAKQKALGEFKALPTKLGMSSETLAPLSH